MQALVILQQIGLRVIQTSKDGEKKFRVLY